MRKIGVKIFLMSMVSIIVLSSALIGIFIYQSYKQANLSIKASEELLLEDYDELIRSQVKNIISQIDSLRKMADNKVITNQQARELAVNILRDARYSEDGYFWCDSTNGINVVLLGNKEIEGKSRIGLTDFNGVKIVENFMNIAKNEGSGFTEYHFPKAGETEPSPKRAYVELYPQYNWVIGTGNYIDDMEEVLNHQRGIFRATTKKSLANLAIVSVIAIVVNIIFVVIFSKVLNKKINKITQLTNITAGLDLADNPDYDIVVSYIVCS